MGAEIFDVAISLATSDNQKVDVLYATKVSSKKNKDTSTTLTFQGDVSTGAKNTGGTISIEGLYFPTTVEDATKLENILNGGDLNHPIAITTVTCSGTSYTANGEPYRRIIIGNGVTVTSDEDEWSPSDAMTQKLELAVDKLTRQAERI